ncbi:polymerase i polypeptide 30kda, putative [Ichthyophthirius multifiliis]|uniref:DNA-directed RNA polymerases I and III subunit RPAC1 n=1 Tax=Ichthyophthirius multifiliis TaxID=5932 RepID=G0R291_ICHMU|nr:polymerase i polypeptide 30kda, putative [Ichthyophthirius multifiliis]EGR28416.1 polymerase i polypeptide 30kda, putative [Ichthyophthirius multifiliis]|eukprot:XP_004029652.1 polymerase i polypeptide 30kda, putative [Ichthyophthirius multifiliis]
MKNNNNKKKKKNQEINYSAAFISQDQFNTFVDNIKIEILNSKPEQIEFQLQGVDAPIANALRRIMIAEVPTMAIHKVYIYQNTSIIPDEVLAHRLGLLPIQADPRLFEEKEDDAEYNENNSIKFSIKVKCQKKQTYNNHSQKDLENLDPEKYLENAIVYSGQFKWEPIGNQKERFKENIIKIVHDNIIVAKLRENQEIIAEVICQKGMGKNHAKWSPVCTAYYRLMPSIKILEPIQGKKAQQLKEKCPAKVYDVINNQAKVVNEIECTMCRECIREDEELNQKLQLGKEQDNFYVIKKIIYIYIQINKYIYINIYIYIYLFLYLYFFSYC